MSWLMSWNEEPIVPEEPQFSSGTPEESQELYSESVEIRLEIEQRLPGGFIRFSWQSFRGNRRPKKAPAAKSSLRVVIPLIVFCTIIIIGLIAVGPEGVWEEIRDLMPNLFNSAALVSAA